MGFIIFLMALADWLSGRKHRGRERCDLCGREYNTFEEVEVHRRHTHPDKPP